MLARELKSKLKKEGKIVYFIAAQTFKGNSYTCQLSREYDVERFEKLSKELLPYILADNLLPEYPFKEETIITGFKFNEKAGEEGELVKLAQPFLSFHVDDEDIKGKTVQNRIPLRCINRDVENYPDKVKRLVNNFQDFLSEVAQASFASETRQGDIFEENEQVRFEIKTFNNPFEDLEQANKEILGSQALPQENLEGMKAAVAERVKERNAEKLGVPVEIREEEH
jgi:hypothetical protein